MRALQPPSVRLLAGTAPTHRNPSRSKMKRQHERYAIILATERNIQSAFSIAQAHTTKYDEHRFSLGYTFFNIFFFSEIHTSRFK